MFIYGKTLILDMDKVQPIRVYSELHYRIRPVLAIGWVFSLKPLIKLEKTFSGTNLTT